jgi:hypothetical protein
VRRRRIAATLLLLAIAAAALTFSTSHHALPHGSTDLDEVAYQSQANALRAGHASLSRAVFDPSFRPFLSGIEGTHVVFKYQPVWPALVGASDAAFGTSLPLRMALAIAVVLGIAWLAWELFRDAPVAVLAAAFAVCSPLVWVQTATLLGYSLSFVLGVTTAAALLRTSRTRSLAWGVLAGALFGLDVMQRPFDALIAVLPIAVYVAWRAARSGAIARPALGVVIGGAPFAAVFFAYNHALTGSFTRMTFSATGRYDRFGFGSRASFSVAGGVPFEIIHYDIANAIGTTGRVLALLPRFIGFAPVVAAGIALACWRGRRDTRVWLLVAMIATTLVGYFFWWGEANAAHFHLDVALGPFYYYGLLAPLTILGAFGLRHVSTSRARAVLAIAAVGWLAIAPLMVLHKTIGNGKVRAATLARLDAPTPALVFVSPSFPGDPYVPFANPGDLHGARVVALDLGERDIDVLERYARIPTYVVRSMHVWNQPFDTLHSVRLPFALVGSAAGFDVSLSAPVPTGNSRAASAYIRVGSNAPQFTMQARAGVVRASWHVPVTGLPAGPFALTVGVAIADSAAAPAPQSLTSNWYECRFAGRVFPDGRVELLDPCIGWHHYAFPDGKQATATEDVSSVLPVRVAGT